MAEPAQKTNGVARPPDQKRPLHDRLIVAEWRALAAELRKMLDASKAPTRPVEGRGP